MKCRKINLSDCLERENYSQKLREFEKEFTYPLGEKQFYISHGEKGDYFSFFEQLGKPEFLILEDNNKVIGLVCLILRNINGMNIWYACDFKISQGYRGKKLYRQWMWKFFLPFYIRCSLLFGINMSNPKNNKLFKHTQNIFKIFSIKVEPSYLYEFTSQDIKKFDNQFLDTHSLITNNGFKDIIIEEKNVSLYHFVENNHLQNNLPHHNIVDIHSLNNDDCIMLLKDSRMDLAFAKESIISIIHRKNSHIQLSSAEI